MKEDWWEKPACWICDYWWLFLTIIGLLVFLIIFFGGPIKNLLFNPIEEPISTLMPTMTEAARPTLTLTPCTNAPIIITFTPTQSMLETIVGKWSFVVDVEDIFPGDETTIDSCINRDPNRTTINSYLTIMSDAEGNIWGFTSDSIFAGNLEESNIVEYSLEGHFIDNKLYLEGTQEGEGECQGSTVQYILDFDGNFFSGSKMFLHAGSGNCCGYEGPVVGEKIED